MGQARSFGLGVLLVIVTFGVYAYYWHYKVYDELRLRYQRDQEFPTVLFVLCILPLVSLVAMPLYMSKLMELRDLARARHGLGPGLQLVPFLLWYIVGALIIIGPFIAYYKLQTEINEVWERARSPPLPAYVPSPLPPAQ